MRLDELNAAGDQVAAGAFLRCCGSERWARAMAAARPFEDERALVAAADRVWASLVPADWLQAFAAHPRIGELQPGWASDEQAGAVGAASTLRQRLAEGNRRYEARFGHIFIVCATGKSAEDMLTALDRRLANDPADELAVAAEEQRKITRIRLTKLLQS